MTPPPRGDVPSNPLAKIGSIMTVLPMCTESRKNPENSAPPSDVKRQRILTDCPAYEARFDPKLDQPSVTRDTKRSFERAREVAHREVARLRELRESKRAVEVCAKKLGHAPPLPRSEAAARQSVRPGCLGIALDEVCTDDELELIERER